MLLSLFVTGTLAINGTIGGAHSPECDSTTLLDGTTITVSGMSQRDRTMLDIATFLADDSTEWIELVVMLSPAFGGTLSDANVLSACAAQAVATCGQGKVCGITVVGGDPPACAFTCGAPPCAGPIPPAIPSPPAPVPQSN